MILRPLAALAALLLSACAGPGQDGRGYPSLAKRPVESRGTDAESPPEYGGTAEIPDDDGALDGKLTALTKQVVQGGTAFDGLYEKVAGRVRLASAATVSSEQWVAAQVDLGRLEQARHDSVFALASLDTLYAARMKAVAEGQARGGIDRIEAARASALAIVDSQNDRVDALRAALNMP